MTDGEEIRILMKELKERELGTFSLGDLVKRIILGETALFQYQFAQRENSPDAVSLIGASRDGLSRLY